jgi:hypothetical protein
LNDSLVTSDTKLLIVKSLHTAIWFTVESALLYVLFSGFRGRTDRATKIAAGVVAMEIGVFLGNGARCPLTNVAESLGAESGSVTDIYLPDWFARNLPVIHIPLVLSAVYLHRGSLPGRAKT